MKKHPRGAEFPSEMLRISLTVMLCQTIIGELTVENDHLCSIDDVDAIG